MKVICISDVDDGDCDFPTPFDPQVGDILTVKKFITGYGYKTGKPYPCYIFEEIPDNYCYDTKDFALLSSISETEMERDYNKVTQ